MTVFIVLVVIGALIYYATKNHNPNESVTLSGSVILSKYEFLVTKILNISPRYKIRHAGNQSITISDEAPNNLSKVFIRENNGVLNIEWTINTLIINEVLEWSFPIGKNQNEIYSIIIFDVSSVIDSGTIDNPFPIEKVGRALINDRLTMKIPLPPESKDEIELEAVIRSIKNFFVKESFDLFQTIHDRDEITDAIAKVCVHMEQAINFACLRCEKIDLVDFPKDIRISEIRDRILSIGVERSKYLIKIGMR